MIRNLLLFFACLLLAFTPCLAQNQEIEVNLNRDNNWLQTCSLGSMGNLMISAQPNDDQETAYVTFEIQNTTQNYGLVLFKSNYNEKELKKLKDDSFYEVKTDNEAFKYGVEYSSSLTRNVFVDHDERFVLPLTGFSNLSQHQPDELSLPLYSCSIERKNKNSAEVKKIKLLEQRTFIIKITLDIGPDVEFEALKKECDKLVDEIGKATFCTNDKHKPKLDNQLSKYKSKVEDLNKRVRELAHERNIMSNRIADTKYQVLIDANNKAYSMIQPSDCGKHRDLVWCKQCKKYVEKGHKHPDPDKIWCKQCKKYVEKGHKHPNPDPDPVQIAKTCLGKLQGIFKALDNGRLKGKKKQAIQEATPWHEKLKPLPDSKEKMAAKKVYNKILNY